MSIKEWINNVIIVVAAYGVAIIIAYISGYGITGIEWGIPCLFAFLCALFFQLKKIWEARRNKLNGQDKHKNQTNEKKILTLKKWIQTNLCYTLPISLLFSATVVVGSHIDSYENTFSKLRVIDLVLWVFISIIFALVFTLLFGKGNQINLLNRLEKSISKGKERKGYVLTVGILLLCWLPYYLTFFPGNIGNDTIESVNMCLGNIPWTNHHPVFFTFLINIVIKATSFIGSLNASMGIFSFLHAVIFAMTLAYILLWLYRKKASAKFLFICAIAFAFHPIIAMYSIYLTKDVLFSCATVLFVLKLYDVIQSDGVLLSKKREWLKLVIFALGVITLRNNGLLMVVGTMLCLFIVLKKQRKSVLIMLGSILLIALIYMGPVFSAIGIQSQSFAESASIPLQQVGYVIWTDGVITEENAEFLNQIMPLERVKEVYDPGYTDSYKFDEEFDDVFFNENKVQFMKVWWNMLPANFGRYVKAYLMQTLGYWHYGETNTVCTQGVTENTIRIVQKDVLKQITGYSLESIIEKLVLAARKAPLFCMLSSMAIQFFAVLLCVINDFRTKRAKNAIALVPCVLLWITIMVATPAFCLFRYLFPLFMLWPVLIAQFFGNHQ